MTDEELIGFVDWIDDRTYNNVMARVRSSSSSYFKLWAYHPSGEEEVKYLSTIDLFNIYKTLTQ
jgi:hypothetical protein